MTSRALAAALLAERWPTPGGEKTRRQVWLVEQFGPVRDKPVATPAERRDGVA